MRRILGIVFIFFVVVVPHEFGHFIAAKWYDVPVVRFSIGFGPVLFSQQRGETEICLSAIPLGGYVVLIEDRPSYWYSAEELDRMIAEDPQRYVNISNPRRSLSRKEPAVQFFVSSPNA